MSLIHQALKKIEAAEDAARQELRVSASAYKGRSRVITLSLLICLLAVLGVIALYGYRQEGGRKTVNKAPKASVNPAETGAPVKTKAEVYNSKGVSLFRAGKYEEALNEFNSGLKDNPADSVLYNNIGLTYLSLDDEEKAEEFFKKALESRADYPEALNNYGSVLKNRGELSRAAELFEKSAELDSGYAEARLNLAATLELLGKYPEAVSEYENFLKLSEKSALNDEVKRKAARLRAEMILRDGGEGARKVKRDVP